MVVETMNVRALMLDSILSSIEEDEQSCVESDIVEEIITCIQSIKQSIQMSRDSLKSK